MAAGDVSPPVLHGVQDLAQDLAQDQTGESRRYGDDMSRLALITSDPAICHGQPTIRGLRYTAESVRELLSSGMAVEEVLADFPDLERDDILAALEFGARAIGGRLAPLPAAEILDEDRRLTGQPRQVSGASSRCCRCPGSRRPLDSDGSAAAAAMACQPWTRF